MTREATESGTEAPEELDYEEIETAVLDSGRGRWFLAEFARRNRHAETERLLAAIRRLEANLVPQSGSAVAAQISALRREICEMAEEIAKAKREIASIRPADSNIAEIADATAELDAIIESTERATSDILSAAEQIQELVWTLREQGAPSDFCDAFDGKAADIYTACSFQDITGQRTARVVRVLQLLDARIDAMARLWSEPAESGSADETSGAGRHLLNGPAPHGEGVDQASVDRVMDDAHSGDEADDGESQGAEGRPAADAGAADSDHTAVAGGAEPDLTRLSRADYEALFS